MPTEARALKGISSMATRLLLAQLTEQYERESGQAVAIESVGGVKASQRVLDGEQFDLVVLAAGAMAKLADAGKIDRGTLVGVVRSPIAAAARPGFAAPDMGNEQSIRDAVRGARAIGYSTGPSGTYILSLLERWGLPTGAGASAPRLVQARPGVPVGSLVASGEVDLGFQQLSELMHVEGVQLLGLLPAPIQKATTFSAALAATVHDRAAAQAFLAFLVSPAAEAAKVANGMTAA